jgi:hypothetical protein
VLDFALQRVMSRPSIGILTEVVPLIWRTKPVEDGSPVPYLEPRTTPASERLERELPHHVQAQFQRRHPNAPPWRMDLRTLVPPEEGAYEAVARVLPPLFANDPRLWRLPLYLQPSKSREVERMKRSALRVGERYGLLKHPQYGDSLLAWIRVSGIVQCVQYFQSIVPLERPAFLANLRNLINAMNRLVNTEGQKQPLGQFLGLTNPEGLFPREGYSSALEGTWLHPELHSSLYQGRAIEGLAVPSRVGGSLSTVVSLYGWVLLELLSLIQDRPTGDKRRRVVQCKGCRYFFTTDRPDRYHCDPTCRGKAKRRRDEEANLHPGENPSE